MSYSFPGEHGGTGVSLQHNGRSLPGWQRPVNDDCVIIPAHTVVVCAPGMREEFSVPAEMHCVEGDPEFHAERAPSNQPIPWAQLPEVVAGWTAQQRLRPGA